MEMQQLLSMGFPEETAAQALAATGGGCPLKATEWILTHTQKNSSNDNNLNPNNNSPNSTHVQPKLDRFFRFHSKPPPSTPSPSPSPALNEAPPKDSSEEKGEKDYDEEEALHKKRRKRETAVQLPPLHEPLSERMRPRRIDEVVGQDHLLGRNSFLRSAVDRNRLPSVIFWGPPGTGKTSIARAIVSSCPSSSYRFVSLSAVTCGVKDVRDAVDEARKWMKVKWSTEFHRLHISLEHLQQALVFSLEF